MKIKTGKLAFIALTGLTLCAFIPKNKAHHNTTLNKDSLISIPLGGNAWRVTKDTLGGTITNDGIADWTDKKVKFDAYFRVNTKGKFTLCLNSKVPDGSSKLAVTVLKSTKQVSVSGNSLKSYKVGDFIATDTGYIKVEISAVSKTGSKFADLQDLQLSGPAINSKTAWVKSNADNYFYWGRRGPSVHLPYIIPIDNVEWFYNEVTVPKGNDVMGSYFMADGFSEGYFGMQVNSPTERHILFSVWSPFTTDDPKNIPEDQKIKMLKKGPDVHTGEFGSEGSGGQSYLNYMWKAGNTYKFLVHAEPAENNYTNFTAWFFAPEDGKWRLIASFSRPKTHSYLTGLHSFLENFDPEQGTITRKVLFGNQWTAGADGSWKAVTQSKFTNDATARKGFRMDYAGGVEGSYFYLKNCGFFNHYTPYGSKFTRTATGKMPDVDLNKLP